MTPVFELTFSHNDFDPNLPAKEPSPLSAQKQVVVNAATTPTGAPKHLAASTTDSVDKNIAGSAKAIENANQF